MMATSKPLHLQAESFVIRDTAGEAEIANMMDWLELDSDTATVDEMKKKAISLEDKWGVRII